ncbi:MAG: AAA family ATPase [Candidatus Kerfeldbacteria bacterium]|nr:AAA family ATPase [Candidatus Kerfeldbacteria bacterium]
MIIGLIGPKLSGKGTIAQYLQERRGAVVYSMSGVIVDITNRLYLPKTRANIIAAATAMRGAFGEDVFAQVLKKDIEGAQPALAVIDGIRMPKEVEIFSQLPEFTLIYVDAPLRLRYERALGRGEKAGENNMTFQEFQVEESAVTEQNISSLKEKAVAVIENSQSLEYLYSQIRQIINV